MGAPAFWELAVTAPGEAAEALANFLWECGALGVVEEEDGAGSRLRGFFRGDVAAAALRARLTAYLDALRALGVRVDGDVRLAPLADTAWALAWREHFRPLAVGARLLVAPPWDVPADPGGRVLVVIEPGRAFGTGHHATTAGCLERLDAILAEAPPPATALDLGTGSGILAIAAARLGVARVLAVDDDPDAVACARANAARNGVADRVDCRLADVARVDTDAPLVLANLLAAAHRRLAVAYRRLVRPGGRLVLGGVLDEEAPAVGAALAAVGFVERARVTREGWTTLDFEARSDRDAPVHDRA